MTPRCRALGARAHQGVGTWCRNPRVGVEQDTVPFPRIKNSSCLPGARGCLAGAGYSSSLGYKQIYTNGTHGLKKNRVIEKERKVLE